MKTRTLAIIVTIFIFVGVIAGGAYYYNTKLPTLTPIPTPTPTPTTTSTPSLSPTYPPIPTITPTPTPSIVKEKLKIIANMHTNVIPWRTLNMVSVYIDGYAFKFTVVTDLNVAYGYEMYENKLSEWAVDFANLVVYFDRGFSIRIVKPSHIKEDVFLKIEIRDPEALRPNRFEPPDPIISFDFWNELILTVEWQQPDESTTSIVTNLKRMNVTVIGCAR